MAQVTGKRGLIGEMNVVPYIDVMLVLLIIFMATTPLLSRGVQVDLPKADAKPLTLEDLEDKKPVILSVDAQDACSSTWWTAATARSTRTRF